MEASGIMKDKVQVQEFLSRLGRSPGEKHGLFRYVLLGLLLILSNHPVTAETADQSFPAPQAVSETFTVGVSILKGYNLSKANEYLLASLPQMLLSTVQRITKHTLNPTEEEAYRAKIISDLLEKEKKALSALYTRLDNLFFSLPPTAEKEKLLLEIAKKKDYLLFLESFPAAELEVSRDLDIILPPDNQKGILLGSPFPTLDLYARNKGVDFLIWGTLEELEGYLFLSINSYNSVTKTDTSLLKISGTGGRIQERTRELSRTIHGIILGRPVGYISVKTEPPGSRIKINGETAGTGTVADFPVPLGEVRVAADLPGYHPEGSTVMVGKGERISLEYLLEREVFTEVPVSTVPAGASAYLNAEWVGTTPFFFPLKGVPGELKFFKEGFMPETFIFLPGKKPPSSININLKSVILDQKKYRESLRDEFYKSFGIFVLSIPVPLFCFSKTADLSSLYYLPGSSRDSELLRNAEMWYSGYLGSLGISSFLAVDMIINLIAYVNSSSN